MNNVYLETVARTFNPAAAKYAQAHQDFGRVNVHNRTPIAMDLFVYESSASHFPVTPAHGATAHNLAPGKYFVVGTLRFAYVIFRSATTSAFMGVFKVASGVSNYYLDVDMLSEPNDIGPPPAATRSSPIPQNSPRVMVGCAKLPNGNVVTHDQYWLRLGSSYSLAARETKLIRTSVKTGLRDVSSTSTEVANSLGIHASAGWGPISTSLSASLRTSANRSQRLSISHEEECDIADVLSNPQAQDMTVIRWQLMDNINILQKTDTTKVLSSIVHAQTPVVSSFHRLA